MHRQPIPTDTDLFSLPPGLAPPPDDGTAALLLGKELPPLSLPSTRGRTVNVAEAAQRLSVFFFYPASVRPGIPIPGEWSMIPGARGCTLQNRGFRELYPQLKERGCDVYGVSGQGQSRGPGLAEQVEFSLRLELPFDLLNDSDFELAHALGVPTFVASLKEPEIDFEGKRWTFPLQGRTLVKRLTVVAEHGRIIRAFYPVFPPDQNARHVLDYITREHPSAAPGGGTSRPGSRTALRGTGGPPLP